MRTLLCVVALIAILFSGCLDGDKPGPQDSSLPLVSTTPPPIDVPISWQGKIDAGIEACVFYSPVTFCTFLLPHGDTVKEFPLNGTVSAVNVTLTWTASSALMERLILTAYEGEDCSAEEGAVGCSLYLAIDSVEGTSPLKLSIPNANLTKDDRLVFEVESPNRAPSPAYAVVNTEQPFQLEGSYRVQPVADNVTKGP